MKSIKNTIYSRQRSIPATLGISFGVNGWIAYSKMGDKIYRQVRSRIYAKCCKAIEK
jgi:hypothetical protein